MKTISRIERFSVPAPEVFSVIDNLGVTGAHMTESSAMMIGSKLHLEYLTEAKTGLGSKYRWTGKMMGLTMDFTIEVTKWVNGKEKAWQTIGPAKLIIFSWYEMDLFITQMTNGCEATLSITYKKPKGFFNKILCFLFAKWYCNWCLKRMLGDARMAIETKTNHPSFA